MTRSRNTEVWVSASGRTWTLDLDQFTHSYGRSQLAELHDQMRAAGFKPEDRSADHGL